MEEEGEVQLPDPDVVKGSVWRVVSDFIRSSTGELPYECEHFYLSDLLDHLAGAGQPETFLDYIVELIGRYTDTFTIKEDGLSTCAQQKHKMLLKHWRSRTEPISRSGHIGGGSPVPSILSLSICFLLANDIINTMCTTAQYIVYQYICSNIMHSDMRCAK